MEIEFETEEEVECPKCNHKFSTTVMGYADIDMSDYAPDYSWRD